MTSPGQPCNAPESKENFFLTFKWSPLKPGAQTLFMYADRPENKRTPIFLLQTRHLLIRTTPAKVEISLPSHLEEAPGLISSSFLCLKIGSLRPFQKKLSTKSRASFRGSKRFDLHIPCPCLFSLLLDVSSESSFLGIRASSNDVSAGICSTWKFVSLNSFV